jgi:hypothetical protein
MAVGNGSSASDWQLRGEVANVRDDVKRLEERNDREHARFDGKLDTSARSCHSRASGSPS